MKIVISVVVSLALAANLVGQVTAAPFKEQKASASTTHDDEASARRRRYQHLLDKVPFGSQRWWSIYHGGTANRIEVRGRQIIEATTQISHCTGPPSLHSRDRPRDLPPPALGLSSDFFVQPT
jgi:hypothetical protein